MTKETYSKLKVRLRLLVEIDYVFVGLIWVGFWLRPTGVELGWLPWSVPNGVPIRKWGFSWRS